MTTYTFDEARLDRLEAAQRLILAGQDAHQNTLAILIGAVQAQAAALDRIAAALEKPDDGSLAEALRGVAARLGAVEREVADGRRELHELVSRLTGGAVVVS